MQVESSSASWNRSALGAYAGLADMKNRYTKGDAGLIAGELPVVVKISENRSLCLKQMIIQAVMGVQRVSSGYTFKLTVRFSGNFKQ